MFAGVGVSLQADQIHDCEIQHGRSENRFETVRRLVLLKLLGGLALAVTGTLSLPGLSLGTLDVTVSSLAVLAVVSQGGSEVVLDT